MSHEFDAIFERGVLRPLGPVDLPENARVRIQAEPWAPVEGPVTDVAELGVQVRAVRAFSEWLEQQPAVESASVSAHAHDQILYGWRK